MRHQGQPTWTIRHGAFAAHAAGGSPPHCEALERRLLLSADGAGVEEVYGPVELPDDETPAVVAEDASIPSDAVIVPVEVLDTLNEAVTAALSLGALSDGQAVIEFDGMALTCRVASATRLTITAVTCSAADAVPFGHSVDSLVAAGGVDGSDDAPADTRDRPLLASVDAGETPPTSDADAPTRAVAGDIDREGRLRLRDNDPAQAPAGERAAVPPAVEQVAGFQLTVPVALSRVFAPARTAEGGARSQRAEDMTLGEILAVLNDRADVAQADPGPASHEAALQAAARRRRIRSTGERTAAAEPLRTAPLAPTASEASDRHQAEDAPVAGDDTVVDVIVLAALLQGVRDRAATLAWGGTGGTVAALEALRPLRILERDVPSVATAAHTLPAERPAAWG